MATPKEKLQEELNSARDLITDWLTDPAAVLAKRGISTEGVKADVKVAHPIGAKPSCAGCGCFLVEMRFRT